MILGDWVLVEGKIQGQFIQESKKGFCIIDVNGIWNDYEVNKIDKL